MIFDALGMHISSSIWTTELSTSLADCTNIDERFHVQFPMNVTTKMESYQALSLITW